MKSPQAKASHKPLFLLLLVLGLMLVVAILEMTNITHFFHAQRTSAATSAGQFTKGEQSTPKNGNTPTVGANSTAVVEPGDTKGSTSSGSDFIAPTGTFVSAHKNVPQSATLSSVCNTTVGAQCYISFTSEGVVKTLPAQTTDRGGATYWNSWTPESIGLTAGTWKVRAVATLNGQTKTSDDALGLVITE